MAPPSGRTWGSLAVRRPKMSRPWKMRLGPSGDWAWAWLRAGAAARTASAETKVARRMEIPRNNGGLERLADGVCPAALGRINPLHGRSLQRLDAARRKGAPLCRGGRGDRRGSRWRAEPDGADGDGRLDAGGRLRRLLLGRLLCGRSDAS